MFVGESASVLGRRGEEGGRESLATQGDDDAFVLVGVDDASGELLARNVQRVIVACPVMMPDRRRVPTAQQHEHKQGAGNDYDAC